MNKEINNETPLTVEKLLSILEKNCCIGIAGYNGSCERFIRYDALIKELKILKK